jgi:S-DNA-T family DNA segregation ATPase FtsK/SpoIIIE
MPRHHRRRSPFKRKSFRFKLREETLFSIAAVLLLGLALFILLSFSKQGRVLVELNQLLISTFGWTAYLTPLILSIIGLMFSRLKVPLALPNILLGLLLFGLSGAGITQAGALGQEVWLGLSYPISEVGAFLVLFIGIIVGLLILLNISLDQVFEMFGKLFESTKSLKSVFPGKKQAATLEAKQSSARPMPLKVHGDIEEKSPVKPGQPVKTSDELLKPGSVTNSATGKSQPWQYPPLSLLSESISGKADRGNIKDNANIIERTLESFGITAHVSEVNLGPAVTQYALEVATGTKLSKLTSLNSDLALALAAPQGLIRIEAPIAGRSLVGIELPNRSPEFVGLRKVLESESIKHMKSKLAVALGLDVSGKPLAADIGRMPHVLIAGATGSGKSVCINAFIMSILFRAAPDEVKFIMVDPKRVELTQYNGVPHLLTPVIIEPEKVVSALRWATKEMEERYKRFADIGARNIESYNEIAGYQAMPYLVIMIDELADIMLFAPAEVEDAITRIAQMARATGIHLIVSTQRPSVDIITGLIKANIPCRIAFAVSSQIDSRVIVDGPGAEKLLGRGDMLYIPPDQAKPTRIQGAFVSDKEIARVLEFIKNQGVEPQYSNAVTSQPVSISGRRGSGLTGDSGERDELFEEAVRLIVQSKQGSASYLQRRLSLGYARAARIIDQMEIAGIVGPSDGSKSREVLIGSADEFFNRRSTGSDQRS